jgi:AbrB family looped-hinge helix DNA binding protein
MLYMPEGAVREFESSLSPKGQITVPIELRRRWGLKPKDRVAIQVADEIVTLVPIRSPVDETYGVLPPLSQPLSVEEMTAIAADEHAEETAHEGR